MAVGRLATLCISAAVLAVSQPAMAEDAADTTCFDALVTAQLTRQTPTTVPDCDGCIIMEWPWVLELDVKRVLQGEAPLGRLVTVSVQHTWLATKPQPRRWWLRRNTGGTFNVLLDPDSRTHRCAAETPSARPFHRPGDEQELLEQAQKSPWYGWPQSPSNSAVDR